jgi:hypothetical protein
LNDQVYFEGLLYLGMKTFVYFSFTLFAAIVFYGIVVATDLYFGTGNLISPAVRAFFVFLLTLLFNFVLIKWTGTAKVENYIVSYSAILVFYVFAFLHFLE